MLIPLTHSCQGSKKSFGATSVGETGCYVLITCSPPSEDGQIHVEMTYEGDATLVAYLVESAQTQFEQQGHGL